jgi:chemotaxis signal transduction protein
MLKTFSPHLLSFSNHTQKNTFKSIAFQVSSYWFALPIGSVLRIISCPVLDSPIRDCLGLVEWEKQVVTVIDLSQKISVEPEPASLNSFKKLSHNFLILMQTRSAELCGFLTKKDPILVDIPIANIHSIPSSYRQVAELSIIGKMAILNQPETKQTLKILLLGEWNQINYD